MTTIAESTTTGQEKAVCLAHQLLEKIATKEVRVGVIGLGYVGLPLGLVFAQSGARITGFDVDTAKTQLLAQGKSYIRHIESSSIQEVSRQGRFMATQDFSLAADCDVLIICVPTPLDSHLDPDLHYIEDTCKVIAPLLKEGCLISLESTTWPGTTEEVVKPILESGSGLNVGENLFVCYSPEREDPGNKQYGTRNIPKLVGGVDELSLKVGSALYAMAIDKVVALSSTRVAESAKLFENIFRSVNIALVNELKVIFDPMGIDVWEVIQAAGTKPFGFMPFWPGPGLGGHCIPIDPFYLTWKAKEFGVTTRFIELAGQINRSMPLWVAGKVQDCLNQQAKAVKGSRILVIGLAYKPDVSDMRESPSLELISLLEAKGARVDYHDPFIEEIGKTREYGKLAGRRSQPLSRKYDCFVLATNHSCFSVDEILSFSVPIVDTRHYFPTHELVFRA